MYPREITQPMADELTRVGFRELKTVEDVDQALRPADGTVLVVVNSVCGCAAGAARPGIIKALASTTKKPTNITTVFAGVDTEAVKRARTYFLPFPPSSPSIALFKNGKLVHFIERHHIEGRSADMIAQNLVSAFEEYC